MANYTEKELQALTLNGRAGEKSIRELAKKAGIDETLNKDPLIKELLKTQTKTPATKTDDKPKPESKKKESAKGEDKESPEMAIAQAEAEQENLDIPDKTDDATETDVALTPFDVVEEAKKAKTFTDKDAKNADKVIEELDVDSNLELQAQSEQVAPVEMVRRKAAEYAEHTLDQAETKKAAKKK